MLQTVDYKLLYSNVSCYCLQLSSCQLVSDSTNINRVMIGIGSSPVTCTLCFVCVKCAFRLAGVQNVPHQTIASIPYGW
jgi:hypothetical protein